MSLLEKMTVLSLRISDKTEEITMDFDCSEAFRDGKFKGAYINKCTKSVLAALFPDNHKDVLAYMTLVYKANALMRRVLENRMLDVAEDGQVMDTTEDILSRIYDKSNCLSVINPDGFAPVIRSYYKVQECLKEFGK